MLLLFHCREKGEAVFYSLSFHFVGEKMDIGEECSGRDWEEVVYSVLFSLERGSSAKTSDDPVKEGLGRKRKEN